MREQRLPDTHILPIRDLREHVESRDCWCHPLLEPIGAIDDDEGLATDTCLVKHQALDGRELVERYGLQ